MIASTVKPTPPRETLMIRQPTSPWRVVKRAGIEQSRLSGRSRQETAAWNRCANLDYVDASSVSVLSRSAISKGRSTFARRFVRAAGGVSEVWLALDRAEV